MKRKNMLVETVRERRGETFTRSEEAEKMGLPGLFYKVPNRVPVGVFVGINDHGVIRVGFSRVKLPPTYVAPEVLERFRPEEKQAYLHDLKDSDQFNLDRGITEALRNILNPTNPPVHRGFARRFNKFKVRCERYFKNATHFDDTLVNGEFRKLTPNKSEPAMNDLQCAMETLALLFGGEEVSQVKSEVPKDTPCTCGWCMKYRQDHPNQPTLK